MFYLNGIITKMSKITIQNSFVVLGILLLLAGFGAKFNSGSDTSFSIIGGTNLLLAALAINARKKQFSSKSNKLSKGEILSILVISVTTLLGFLNGFWYLHPITFLFIPIIVGVGYLYTWNKFRRIPRDN